MTNKEVIRAMYREFFNGHDVEAAKKYVREDYVQHNPGVGQGRQALMDGFRQKFIDEPTFHLEIQKIIEEDDLVAVYLKNVDPEGKTKCRVVDIYRMQDGLLAEHWDVLQPC
jgi:predicted SnoaL-like aldol condensation-catalyzing enzyme